MIYKIHNFFSLWLSLNLILFIITLILFSIFLSLINSEIKAEAKLTNTKSNKITSLTYFNQNSFILKWVLSFYLLSFFLSSCMYFFLELDTNKAEILEQNYRKSAYDSYNPLEIQFYLGETFLNEPVNWGFMIFLFSFVLRLTITAIRSAYIFKLFHFTPMQFNYVWIMGHRKMVLIRILIIGTCGYIAGRVSLFTLNMIKIVPFQMDPHHTLKELFECLNNANYLIMTSLMIIGSSSFLYFIINQNPLAIALFKECFPHLSMKLDWLTSLSVSTKLNWEPKPLIIVNATLRFIITLGFYSLLVSGLFHYIYIIRPEFIQI